MNLPLCDLRIEPFIFVEAKTLAGDDEKQCRMALSQLLYLEYCYAEEALSDIRLVALFDRKPNGRIRDLLQFMRKFSVVSVWKVGGGFAFDEGGRSDLGTVENLRVALGIDQP